MLVMMLDGDVSRGQWFLLHVRGLVTQPEVGATASNTDICKYHVAILQHFLIAVEAAKNAQIPRFTTAIYYRTFLCTCILRLFFSFTHEILLWYRVEFHCNINILFTTGWQVCT